jgi:FecR-like protein/outer membrane lipoprotein YfiO
VIRDRYAALAARLLRSQSLRRAPDSGARARGLATIERALGAQHRRNVLLRRLAFAAAATIACVLGASIALRSSHAPIAVVRVVASPVGSGAALVGWNGESPLGVASELTLGSRLTTPKGGGALLEMSTGSRLELGEETVLGLQSHTELQRFSLVIGQLRAEVAKLGQRERFVVDTPDVQAEVRGTAFTIAVLVPPHACRGLRTRLDVHEGVVEVRTQGAAVRVGAGEHWPRDCAGEPASDVQRQRQPEHSIESHERDDPPRVRASTPRQRESSLGEQNDLFERAARAGRGGDTAAARAAYSALLLRYPDSALAEDALAGLMRALRTSDHAAARRAAERYLQRYPGGFAREEARRIVDEH